MQAVQLPLDPQKQAILDAFKEGRLDADETTRQLLRLDLERRRRERPGAGTRNGAQPEL